MAQNETWLKHDLLEAVKVQYLDGNLFSMDNAGNLIGVTLTRDGEDYSGGGSVSANVIRSDGGTVAVSGALSGKTATVVLPQAAYAVPGVVSIIVKLTASGQVTTIAALVANVYRSSTDTAVDPGTIIPSIQTLISQINTAVASIPADYSALWTKLAPAFSTDASYVAGQYVTYNSGLYRFNTSHSGSWSSSDVTAVNLCGEITELKSALSRVIPNYMNVKQMPITINNGRLNVYESVYAVKDNIIYKYILLSIAKNDISSADTWSLGNIPYPQTQYEAGKNNETFTAVSLDGTDISSLTFKQSYGGIYNFTVTTTGAVPLGFGGVIMLTSETPITATTVNPPDETAEPENIYNSVLLNQNIFDSTFAVADKAWQIANNRIETLNGYSYVQLRIVGGIKIHIKNLRENFYSYGYAIRSVSGSILKSGGETNDMTIEVPDSAHYLVFSYPTANANTLQIIPFFKSSYYPDYDEEIETIENCEGTELINGDETYSTSTIFRTDNESVERNIWPGYGMFTIKNIEKYAAIELSGYSESMNTFGYGIYDAGNTLLAKGGVGNKTIIIPEGASYIYISIKESDKDDISYIGKTVIVHKIDVLEERIEKEHNIIILGDSWSDTVHTTYTKWPEIFADYIDCNIHNYAQNGSSFYGETPNYGQNGNVKGQTQTAIQDTTFDHSSVDLIIMMGGINDYRQSRTASDTITAFVSRKNEMKAEFTNARVVVFLNNQIYITGTLWEYIQTVKAGIKKNAGVPVYSMAGWVPSENYISDLVHVDNTGYKMLAANVIACCFGGSPTFIQNEGNYTIEDNSGNEHTLTIREIITDSEYKQAIKLIVPSGVAESKTLTLTANSSDQKLLGMLTNYCFMQNIGRTTAAALSNLRTSYYQSAIATEDSNHRGLTGTIVVQTGQLEGTYVGVSVPN